MTKNEALKMWAIREKDRDRVVIRDGGLARPIVWTKFGARWAPSAAFDLEPSGRPIAGVEQPISTNEIELALKIMRNVARETGREMHQLLDTLVAQYEKPQ